MVKTAVLSLLATVSIAGAASAQSDLEPVPNMLWHHAAEFATCYAPGTPIEVIMQATQRAPASADLHSLTSDSTNRFQFPDTNRWSTTATDGSGLMQGDPTVLTWSIVPDGTSVYGFNGEPTGDSDLKAFLNGIYGNEATWLALFQQVFDRWSELSGVQYVYEPNDDGAAIAQLSKPAGVLGVRGDVRISGHPIDGNYGVLAYNFYPNVGDMVIDTADIIYSNTNNNSRILRNTVAHEAGHGLGIRHVCPLNATKLMEPILATGFDGPQHDDILAMNRGYGDVYEHNNAVGSESALGFVASFGVTNLSIDDNLDEDVFRFQAGDVSSLDAVLTPVGASYLNGPQNANGSCSAGTMYDSLTVQDLVLEVLGPDGSTVLASKNLNGAGSAESVSGLSLSSGAGNYYLRLSGDATDEAQLFSLEMTVTAAESGCNGNNVVISGASYASPDDFTCVGNNSLSIGPAVTVGNGAKLKLVAPTIAFQTEVSIQPGALFTVTNPVNSPLTP